MLVRCKQQYRKRSLASPQAPSIRQFACVCLSQKCSRYNKKDTVEGSPRQAILCLANGNNEFRENFLSSTSFHNWSQAGRDPLKRRHVEGSTVLLAASLPTFAAHSKCRAVIVQTALPADHLLESRLKSCVWCRAYAKAHTLNSVFVLSV